MLCGLLIRGVGFAWYVSRSLPVLELLGGGDQRFKWWCTTSNIRDIQVRALFISSRRLLKSTCDFYD